MYLDKERAKKGQWRISEKTLFTCASCFGAYGIWLGMNQFRHKTKHTSFRIFIPMLIIIESILLFGMYTQGIFQWNW